MTRFPGLEVYDALVLESSGEMTIEQIPTRLIRQLSCGFGERSGLVVIAFQIGKASLILREPGEMRFKFGELFRVLSPHLLTQEGKIGGVGFAQV